MNERYLYAIISFLPLTLVNCLGRWLTSRSRSTKIFLIKKKDRTFLHVYSIINMESSV